jgi:branched-chain amino acid transport system permease protein
MQFFASPSIIAYAMLLLMYVALSQAYNLVSGYVGDLSFGHTAFFGVGAFTVALSEYYGFSHFSPVNVALGGVFAAFLAILIGFPFLRLKGTYFAIGSLALAEVMRIAFLNSDFTLSSRGIYIPIIEPYSRIPYYSAIVGISAAVTIIVYLIINSRLGITFIAIRDDPDVARVMGINVTLYRILSLTMSAFICGVVGGWFAYYNAYVYPNNVFNMTLSFELMVMTFFGGAGTILGPIIGAVIVLFAEEIGRTYILVGYPLILAILIMITFMFMPGGIIGTLTKSTPAVNPFSRLSRSRKGVDLAEHTGS